MSHTVHSGRSKPLAAALFSAFLFVGCSHKAPTVARNPIVTPPPAVGPAKPLVSFTKPDHVRGIYLTAWAAGSHKMMKKIYDLIDTTYINSVVIDVRDDGEMYWKMGIPLAKQVHANTIAIVNARKMMAELAAHHVYPIARIACFRDKFVPLKFPQRAVQYANGKVWHDHSGHTWLDPYNKDNWDYMAKVIDFALDIGFPEIQLDYVRFPSEGSTKEQHFPAKAKYGDPKAKPEDVIAAFVEAMRDKVKKRGAVYSADVFGIISSTKKDEGIGQALEKMASPFDMLSPMVYPSHFHAGEYGIKAPVAEPYEILTESLGDFKKRLPGKSMRPWLQAFTLSAPNQPLVHYGAREISEQIRAAQDLGYDDFLLWNAANHYVPAELKTLPKRDAAAGSETKTGH